MKEGDIGKLEIHIGENAQAPSSKVVWNGKSSPDLIVSKVQYAVDPNGDVIPKLVLNVFRNIKTADDGGECEYVIDAIDEVILRPLCGAQFVISGDWRVEEVREDVETLGFDMEVDGEPHEEQPRKTGGF
jgi:hypothetical protein